MTAWMVFATAWMGVLMVATLVRMFRGPTQPDRVVALDAINTLVVATMILLSAIKHQTIFVDVAIVYALLSYVGTLYIAKAIEKGYR